MEIILDSVIMILLGFFAHYTFNADYIPVVEIFIILIFSALNFILIEKKGEERKNKIYAGIKKGFIFIVFFLTLLFPSLIFFMPVLLIQNKWKKEEVFIFVFLMIFFSRELIKTAFLLTLSALGFIISFRQNRYQKLKEDYYSSKGEADFLYRNLRMENHRLVENQNIEIVNTTLKERNRISKEIHDNVGHLLSSALLQMGALEFLISEDLKEPFSKLRHTMEEAMEKTRKSVHGLCDKSLNMEMVLRELKEDFKFCPLYYNLEIEKEPEAAVHYAFESILKEALSNISRHSDADEVEISLTEVRGDYHLLIRDNGSPKKEKDDRGLGLLSMRERVEDLKGNFYLNKENGYRIFITIPSKEK